MMFDTEISHKLYLQWNKVFLAPNGLISLPKRRQILKRSPPFEAALIATNGIVRLAMKTTS